MNVRLVSYLSAFVAGALVTFFLTKSYYEIKVKEIAISAYQSSLNQADEVIEKEREYNAFFNTKTVELTHEITDINLAYDNAVNSLFDDSGSDKTVLSSDADSSSTVSESRCECSFKDREKFQRLYEKQLTIARDCDITTIHYNQLINLYNGIK